MWGSTLYFVQKVKMSEEEINLPNIILPNNKKFENGKNLDIACIFSSRNIKRFPLFGYPDKCNNVDHQWLTSILVSSYCDYMATHFQEGKFKDTYQHPELRLNLLQAVLTHDVEELVFNDSPTQINESNKKEREFCRELIRKKLNINIQYSNAIEKGIEHLDKCAALLELRYYSFYSPVIPEMIKFYVEKIKEFELLDYMLALGIPKRWLYEISTDQSKESKIKTQKGRKKK